MLQNLVLQNLAFTSNKYFEVLTEKKFGRNFTPLVGTKKRATSFWSLFHNIGVE